MNRINQKKINELDKETIEKLLDIIDIQEKQWTYCVYHGMFRADTGSKQVLDNIPASYLGYNLLHRNGEAICNYFGDCLRCIYKSEKCTIFRNRAHSQKNRQLGIIDAQNVRKRLLQALREKE